MESIPNIYAMVPSLRTGYRYLKFLFLDTFSDLLPILSSSQKFVSIFHEYIMHGSDISWRTLQKKLCLPQWNLISEISSRAFPDNLLLSEEMSHRNSELTVDIDTSEQMFGSLLYCNPFPSSCCCISRLYTYSLCFRGL